MTIKFNKLNKLNKNGLTLIEIIIALAILSIMVLGFFQIFTTSFSHIIWMGNKTSAMSDAQEIIDSAYINSDTSDTFMQSINSEDILKIDDCTNLPAHSYDGTHRIIYCVDSEVLVDSALTKLTVKVFYRNGNDSVILSSVIP
ncbi:MAG: prepilin-type N-terminal cleavage/methylation domain-containing protein [Bacillota bacterium]|nr:prepilin-type N-terminal cleavage/methylation domain-containing protein [Bacillota bacterium]